MKPVKSKRITFTTANPNMKMSAPGPNAAPGSIATLKGTAIAYNQLSDDRGGYKVKLVPKSASFTTPAFALFQHEFTGVLGNTANQSLRLIPTDAGVDVEIDIPDTSTARDVKTLIEGGWVGGMSFTMKKGFEQSFATKEDGVNVLNVTKFTVDEVTVCANPAFGGTSIEVVDPQAEDEDDADPDEVEYTRKVSAQFQRNRHYLYQL